MYSTFNTRAAHRKGFTLIELLVVIAIIAILAAILFPVFAKAREKARQITCASNLKQIGLAIIQYNQDYDEQMPEDGTALNQTSWSNYVTWQETIYPYIKNGANAPTGSVFSCPSNSNQGYVWQSAPGVPAFSCDYAANRNDSFNSGNGNSWANGNGAFPTQTGYVSIASFSSPAQLIALVENNGNACGSGGWNIDPTATGTTCVGALFAGHTGTSNWLFCDGHVKALHPFDTLSTLDGGTASSNLWVRNGVAFSDPSNPNSSSDLTQAKAFLGAAVNQYK